MAAAVAGAGTSEGLAPDDPRAIIGRSPMGWAQIVAVAITVFLNALDGFDVLSISFAAPGIANEWGIDRAALGVVLSIELFGMAFGSVLLGGVCDKVGRRPMVLACLAVMSAGMLASSFANNIWFLAVTRLLTGLGIGGMLAATNAVVAEYSNDRHRSLAVGIMAAGYPLGAVLGGAFASWLLVDHSWRSVFLFGSVATAVCIPVVLLLLPETVPWLAQHQPRNALARINDGLKRMGHRLIESLPPAAEARPGISTGRLFQGGMAPVTILLTLGYFAHILTFYFILKWVPKIVVDMGFHPSSAGSVLVWANVGGFLGSIGFSLLTSRLRLDPLTIGAMLISTVMVAVFGRSAGELTQLSLLAAIAGFFANGGVVGLYALCARSFPTDLRAGGTGFVIGVGRGGAALSPIVAGLLFAAGKGLPTVALLMSMGSTLAAAMLFILMTRKAKS